MVSLLSYKANAAEVLERLRGLYEREATDRIFASFDIPSPALRRFGKGNPEGFCAYVDPYVRIQFWEEFLAERRDVEDDSIPSVYLTEMDQGLYGGLVGGEVEFMCDPSTGWISSMVPPLLEELADAASLEIDEEHPWFARYLRQLQIFVEQARGRFGVSHFILINGLNFVFELIGATRTYNALLDTPELVRGAVDFAFDLNLRVQRAYFEHAWSVEGGTFSNMAQWLPGGRLVSESVDPFHMTSVDYFEEWGRGPVERIFGQFDGGVMHVHGNGRHLLEAVASVRGLKALYLGDDVGFPLAFDVLGEIRQRTGDLPLVVGVEYGSFCDRLKLGDLPGGVFYLVKGAPGLDEANRAMDRARVYRA